MTELDPGAVLLTALYGSIVDSHTAGTSDGHTTGAERPAREYIAGLTARRNAQ